jgi:hypothetical protein
LQVEYSRELRKDYYEKHNLKFKLLTFAALGNPAEPHVPPIAPAPATCC